MANPTWEKIVEEDRRLKALKKKSAQPARTQAESDHAKTLAAMVEAEERHAKDMSLDRPDGVRDGGAIVQAILG